MSGWLLVDWMHPERELRGVLVQVHNAGDGDTNLNVQPIGQRHSKPPAARSWPLEMDEAPDPKTQGHVSVTHVREGGVEPEEQHV
jgi:hypothetical protein